MGVPGVYRVPRRRVFTAQGGTGAAGAVDPWIQQPDYTLTIALTGIFEWQTTTPQVDPGTRTDEDFAIDVGDGEDLAAPPSSAGGIDNVIDTILALTYFGDDLQGHAIRGHNGLDGEPLTDLSLGSTSGTYEFPTADDYEFESPAATFVDANLAGDVYCTDGAPGSAAPAVSGSLWVGQTHYNPFRPVSEIVAADTELHNWSGATHVPWSEDFTPDQLFGTPPESGGMRLTVLNSGLTSPGAVVRPSAGPPAGQAEAVASIQGLTLTCTMRPPRHRIL